MDLNQLELVLYPDPFLRQNAQLVNQVDGQIVQIGEKMIDVMVESSGVGLAGPQVGIGLRIIVVSPTGKREDAQVFINPELSNLDGVSEMEEGCLSVPDVRAKVKRAESCTLDALDIEGNKIHLDATDFYATILQHETDHLNGKLFIDRVSPLGKMAIKRKLKMLEYEYKEKA